MVLGLKREEHVGKEKTFYSFHLEAGKDGDENFLPIDHELVEYEKDGEKKSFHKYSTTINGIEIPVKVSCQIEEKTGKQLINNILNARK